ncbi:Ras-associating and dilute domain-containing protein [Aix galericulata]|nr:Ras-associating and dilute domain-containing protein [Aix galericulata]
MRVLAGAKRLSTPPALRRSLSESSLGRPASRDEEQLRRHCSTLPDSLRAPASPRGPAAEERSGSSMRYSLYQSPHLLLLQGYSQQHKEIVKEIHFGVQELRGARTSCLHHPRFSRGKENKERAVVLLARGAGSGGVAAHPAQPPLLTPRLPARQDSLVYLLNREQHTVGQRTQASKPSISLSAPDILPLHCTIRKLRASRHRSEEQLVLEPSAGAGVSINFCQVARTAVLRHGDLLSLGLYYLLLYKDPTKAQPLPAQTLLRLRALHPEGPPVCGACGSLLRERGFSGAPSKKRGSSPTGGPRAPRRKLMLEFEPAAEDVLLRRIVTLIEPGGDDHKLTPAFLLCLCIQHSATSFEPGDFGQLLLKAAKMIQRTVWVSRWGGAKGWGQWGPPPGFPSLVPTSSLVLSPSLPAQERTRELAEKQSQHQDPAALSRFGIADLLPDLQHILFWMSNAIEVLYFVQQKSPTYIQSMEEELDVKGSKESLFSSTITASEEAMTVLEEVIMYTFQQCVYYISKPRKSVELPRRASLLGRRCLGRARLAPAAARRGGQQGIMVRFRAGGKGAPGLSPLDRAAPRGSREQSGQCEAGERGVVCGTRPARTQGMLLGCSVLASLSAAAQRGGVLGVGCGSCKKQTNKQRKERGAAVSSQLLLPPGQCLYVSLPALLECNPFPNPSEGREGWRASPPLPEELRRVVLTYQAVLDLLRQYEVHPEITSQMFAYLFFFSNTLLFNQLLDKGSSLGCFHWSQGVKLRASVRLLLEWLRGAGFEQLAQQFFAKLASVANLLAMPGSQLLQLSWPALRAEFPALSPAQLHRVLSQCQAVMDVGFVAAWQPGEEESTAAFQHEGMLESFDNHPPIILPSGGFKVDLEVETLDDNIYRHLLYIRHFLWSLQSKSPHGGEGPGSAPPKVASVPAPHGGAVFGVGGGAFFGYLFLLFKKEPRATPEILDENVSLVAAPGGCTEPELDGSPQPTLDANGCPRQHLAGEPQLQEKLQQLQLGRGTAPPAPSCLLTPPTTPLNFDSASPESPQGTGKALQDPRRNGMNGTKSSTPEGTQDRRCPWKGCRRNCKAEFGGRQSDNNPVSPLAGCSPTPYDYPTPESSSRSSATDDFCYVFVVELERGPLGLGMGLIDGLHTPLTSPGIYIRTLIEDSPAAADGRLSIGDRILAVNGTSLIGADYQRLQGRAARTHLAVSALRAQLLWAHFFGAVSLWLGPQRSPLPLAALCSAVDLIRSGGKKLRFLVAKSDMEIAKKIVSSSSSS